MPGYSLLGCLKPVSGPRCFVVGALSQYEPRGSNHHKNGGLMQPFSKDLQPPNWVFAIFFFFWVESQGQVTMDWGDPTQQTPPRDSLRGPKPWIGLPIHRNPPKPVAFPIGQPPTLSNRPPSLQNKQLLKTEWFLTPCKQ